MKSTSKPLLKSESSIVPNETENTNATKPWEKYLSKSSPKPKNSTQSSIVVRESLPDKSTDSSLLKLKPNSVGSSGSMKESAHKVPKKASTFSDGKKSTPRIGDEKPTPSTSLFQNKTKKDDSAEVNIHVPSTNQETATPSSNNTSVNISIDVDIDVNLKSSFTSVSPNVSGEYTSYDPEGTESPKDREKRYEKKRIVAGVILVVLVSLSAGCALLLVIMPSNYDVVTRKYRNRPDQVALIPSRNRCRPRFYDTSLYMGH
ncbi:hypothetical protein NPIL_135491 [Nephila pilipes]|uniref:Uncharacterized protein n=1 Tax=Nephila pilipes TaxID=299642 RepID=A0A8X6N6W6_NEPPI|nr:hypothetical protein NPIL_135491 [Nephila pilipes]